MTVRISSSRFFMQGLLSLLVALTGCNNAGGPPDKKENRAQAPASPPEGLAGTLECSGTLQARGQLEIVLRPGEQIVKCFAQEGASVSKGAPLIQLGNEALMSRLTALQDNETKDDQVEIVRLKIQTIKASIETLDRQISQERHVQERVPDYLVTGKLKEWMEAKQKQEEELAILEKQNALSQRHLLDRGELDRFRRELIAALQVEARNLLITAPFDGRIVRIHSEKERLSPGEKVLQFWDDSRLIVRAKVWQHQLPLIRKGQKARIFPDFFAAQFVNGTVTEMSSESAAGQEDGFPVFPIIIEIEETAARLVPGMVVAVQIQIAPGS